MIRIQKRVHEIVEGYNANDPTSRAFHVFIFALIVANVGAIVLDTVQSVHEAAPGFFWGFEVVSVAIFSTEYLLRLWSCTVDPRYAEPVRGRLRYALTFMALVDLLAVLPFYLQVRQVDLRFIRSVRLFRLFRLLKLARYSVGLQTLGHAIRKKKEELLIIFFVLMLLLVLSSSVMYFAEHEAQPKAFTSIPSSMWWAIITLTTVGYGDIYPVTLVGKICGAMVAILGIGMFALPTGIMGAAFLEEIQSRRKPHICPHCGKNIEGEGEKRSDAA